MTDATRLCLDLFAGLGGFSGAFRDSDNWRVVTVDVEEQFEPNICADIMDLRPSDLPDADVILASPPCTCFSHACNGYHIKDGKPITEKAREHVALVHHTIGLIKALSPDYWFLENPRGNLARFIDSAPEYVTYCQYGEDYMKPTHLWGEHPPMKYRSCAFGDACHESRPSDDGRENVDALGETPAKRAKVPYELSEAILKAVEGRAEQQTLTEACE